MMLFSFGMQGVFLATNLFLFYVFWEVMLVPAYLLVGMFGGPRRGYAAIKFVLYTSAGSLLMLVGIIARGIAVSDDRSTRLHPRPLGAAQRRGVPEASTGLALPGLRRRLRRQDRPLSAARLGARRL